MRRARAALAMIAVATGLVGAPGVATAAASPTIALVSQDLVVAPGGTASFTFTVAGVLPEDTEVVIEAYGKLASPRADLEHVIAGNVRNRDVGFVAMSLDRLIPDGPGRYTVPLPTVTTASERIVGGNALLPDAGMYPITVELRADNEPLAQIVTTVVRTDAVGAAPVTPLDVALVLPLGGAVTLRPDGSTVIDTADRTRLQTVATALAASSTPATVEPRPELIDGLARTGLPGDAELRTALAGAVGGRQVLASPYVAMDPAAVVRGGLGGELTRQLAEGEDALASALGGTAVDRSAWVVRDRMSDGAVSMLRDLGVRRLVVPSDALMPPTAGEPAPTTIVTAADGDGRLPVDVAVADPGLARAFDQRDDPVLAAYQFVTELLAIGMEHASATGRQGVVVVPPEDWQPDPTFLATTLSLVGQNPLLHAVTLDQWFREVAAVDTPTRRLAAAQPVDLTDFAEGLTLTRIRLGALASMLPAADPLPVTLEAQLRVANAGALTTTQRQSYLDAVNAQLDVLGDAVDPIAQRRVSLASRTTELPITLHRRGDRPIQVRVHLESPKLSFPENDILVTLDTDTVQQRIAVQARANGTFPLTVRILTPEGGIPVAPMTELTVQATTLSGFGVALTVGALLVLATWWVRHIRRNRRQRGVAEGSRHHPSGAAPPTTVPNL